MALFSEFLNSSSLVEFVRSVLMSQFTRFTPGPTAKITKKTSIGKTIVDYKDADQLRRLLTPNGKIQTRKRAGLNARDQRLASRAIKRARHMALLPYTSATL